MVVGVVVCELHLPQSRSLKDKRRVVKSLVEKTHQRFRASTAETDFHDLLQRAEISIAVVGREDGEVEALLESIRSLFEEALEAYVTRWDNQLLEVER
jgi:uncharacterized protein